MFEELNDLDSVDLSEIKNVDVPPTPSNFPNTKTYDSNKKSNYFPRKEEVVEDPYIPVAIYVDRDFPQEVKDALYNIASKLINKKITVIDGLDPVLSELKAKGRNLNQLTILSHQGRSYPSQIEKLTDAYGDICTELKKLLEVV